LFAFPTKTLRAFKFSLIRTSCPAHLTFVYMLILVMFNEEYKL
jgi:hypothetical protein